MQWVMKNLLLMTLLLGLSACGGGGGDAPADASATGAEIAVVGDNAGSKITDFLTSRGLRVENIYGRPGSERHRIWGDYVVWEDERHGNEDIYAYRISTGEEFAITREAGDQRAPSIHGDYVVWYGRNNGNNDIFGYQLSTGRKFPKWLSTA